MISSTRARLFARSWSTTVDKYQAPLEPADLELVQQITSWDALEKSMAEEASDFFGGQIPYEISLVLPALGHLGQFASIFEFRLCLQADFFWGILGLLLKLTAKDPKALSTIPRMLKTLGYKAETFNRCHATSRENEDEMNEACFDIQIQLVSFFTSAVKYMRDEDEDTKYSSTDKKDDTWLRIQRQLTTNNQELTETIARVSRMSSSVRRSEGSADVATLTRRLRFKLMPAKKTSRFFDRVDIFEKLDLALGGESSGTSFRAVALYGLGGIGKSSIAARYMETSFEKNEYDAVFWVHGEKTASLRQSFTNIAMRLKLDGAKPNLHDDNLILVQNWLQFTGCKWLVVYDNVESADILMPFWPEASHGRAIITTRNHSLAYEPASSGLEVTSWDNKDGTEFLLFLLKRSIGNDIQVEEDSASQLASKLSGHALAISHLAGLIHRRSWSITEFMQAYSKNPGRAHQTELQAVCDFSFARLDKDSRTFLGIASFLVSDSIPQTLFEYEETDDIPEDLDFCADESSFWDVIENLLILALITRDRDNREFSCHRIVQAQFRYFMPFDEQQRAFENAVALVYRVFPKQSDGANHNQLYQHWNQCNRHLQHVLSLKDNFKEDRRLAKSIDSLTFCELLKDCQRFLYESNALKDLEDVCEVNLMAVQNLNDKKQAISIAAWTMSHQASMYESTGRVQKAIELNMKGYEMRLAERPLKGGLLGGFEQNLAYNYNTANDHETALMWFEKSRDTWVAENMKMGRGRDWPIVTKKNMARCLVYLGQYDRAQELLNISIAEFKKERPLNWAMLAYAYFVQGTLERRKKHFEAAEASFIEAQNLWTRGDQTKLHPFYSACLYKTGVVCLDQGKVEAAIKHVRDSLEGTKFHSSVMPVEHARGLFKLSEMLIQESYDEGGEAIKSRDEAEVFLRQTNVDVVEFGSEADYDMWVPIFWR